MSFLEDGSYIPREDLQNSLFDLEPPDMTQEAVDFAITLDDFAVKELILERTYQSIPPAEFYRFIFPEGSFERLGHQEDKKGNGIALSIDIETKRATKTILTDGHEQLSALLEEPFVILSPISYFGRSRKAKNALWLHALTLDIDYVGEGHLGNLLNWFEGLDLIPRPTFIVNSGHGLHLYYVFERPIAMYERNQQALLKLKRYLIERIWTRFTSYRPERVEALGITQGFRMVGSLTKLPGYRLSAYRTGDRVSLDYLNSYVADGSEAIIDQPSLFSLEDAKEQWPEWYECRVVRGETPGRWHIKRDLYDWFLRRIESETKVGHRYFCLMCLAVYARKCNIEEEELRRDAVRLHAVFDELGKKTNESFGWDEVEKALEAYNENYITFPRETIERLTAIPMPANKRNGRTRIDHITRLNRILDMDKDFGEGEKRGRPKGSVKTKTAKGEKIRAYKTHHPEANHSEIARALKVSRPTVIKWLNMGDSNKK